MTGTAVYDFKSVSSIREYKHETNLHLSIEQACSMLKIIVTATIQSNPFLVSPKCSVNPPTRSTKSYPALQIFTCYRVSPVTVSAGSTVDRNALLDDVPLLHRIHKWHQKKARPTGKQQRCAVKVSFSNESFFRINCCICQNNPVSYFFWGIFVHNKLIHDMFFSCIVVILSFLMFWF